MRYLGGKHRQARSIAAAIAPRGRWRDATCGGLSVSVALAAYGPGIVSDANAALINAYRAVASGWDPPEWCTREEYEAAKILPDTDPRKGFLGVAAAYGGMWFSGYYAPRSRRWKPTEKCYCYDDPIGTARRTLRRQIAALNAVGWELRCEDATTWEPPGDVEVAYFDPPYAGTAEYRGAPPMDHAALWARCRTLARRCRVFVSEYACPVPHEVAWSRPRGCMLTNSASGEDRRSGRSVAAREEFLFRVLPA